MAKSLDDYIGNLPPYIGKEIFQFIIPYSRDIRFELYFGSSWNDLHSSKYDSAFIGDKLIQNEKGEYLSRIQKKNGKHRYYLTDQKEIAICKGCGEPGCRSWGCRGGFDYECYYISKYVGKDLDKALLELFIREPTVPRTPPF